VQPVALVALEQPIRADAAPTLAYFAAEGVTVKVISGDHPVTVGAIARRLNLPHADDPVDASELPTDPGELETVSEGHTVFGRVGPEQKQALITALQRRGHHVAMTGDGVNDVLALKDADIGIAMGNGSDASRGVAQLVLLDSRFAVVPGIVAEGRRVIGNIERVANLFLTKTVYATVLSITVIIAGLPFLFLPRHLTLIGSLTIGIPAFFLALLPNTERARPGFLRRVLRFAVPSGIIAAFAAFSAFRVAELDSGNTRVQAQTSAALVLAAVALWVLGIVARPFTAVKLAVVSAMVGGFAVVLVTPWLRTFFSLDMPQPETLVLCAVIAGIGMVALELGWRLSGWLPKLWARVRR
jgi:cation-transporting ATPase E